MNQGFNPYAPPQQQYPQVPSPYGAPQAGWGAPQYQVAGGNLVAMNGAYLPDVCLKCGANHGLTRKRKNFTWVPQWVYFILLLSLLIGAIMMAILQKRGSLDIPLCDRCRSRWTTATIVLVLSIVSLFLVLPLMGVVIASDVLPRDVAPLFAILLIVGWLVGVVIVSRVFVRARTVYARRIENNLITLAGVHPDALAALATPMAPPAPAYAQVAGSASGGFSGQYGV